MEKEKEEFKPFVPAEKEMKEFSITAVIIKRKVCGGDLHPAENETTCEGANSKTKFA